MLGSAPPLGGRLRLPHDLDSPAANNAGNHRRRRKMTANIGTTTVTTGASELMSNVRGAVQLTFDVFDLLLDARQSAALVGVKSAQQMVGPATFFKTGFDFVNMVM